MLLPITRIVTVTAVSVLVSVTVGAEAESLNVATAPGSGIEISVERPFDAYSGQAPLTIRIENLSDTDGRWLFTFESYANSFPTRVSEQVITVPARDRRRFELTVPLATPAPVLSPLQMTVRGHGIDFGVSYPMNDFYDSPVGVERASSERIAGHKEEIAELGEAAARFEPALLPADWRGFSTFTAIWIAGEDWREIRPGARVALREWIALGGHLVIVSDALPADATKELGLGRGESPARLGFGRVSLLEAPGETPAFVAPPAPPHTGANASWDLGEIEQRSGLLGLFCLGYALTIGPVNLFVFARKRRGRLFWTTPLTALGASLGLVVLIVLQEGLGGTGKRVTAILLMPELAREVVVQDQASRTGALLSSRFELAPQTAIYDRSPGAQYPPRRVESRGTRHYGDWFQSRSIQVQTLASVRPSRARIEQARPEASAADGAPVLVSSLEVPLAEIFYRDRDGLCWWAKDLRPGRPTPLERSSEEAFIRFRESLELPPAARVTSLVEELGSEREFFYGVAPEASPDGLETLTSIDWELSRSLYLGRLARLRQGFGEVNP